GASRDRPRTRFLQRRQSPEPTPPGCNIQGSTTYTPRRSEMPEAIRRVEKSAAGKHLSPGWPPAAAYRRLRRRRRKRVLTRRSKQLRAPTRPRANLVPRQPQTGDPTPSPELPARIPKAQKPPGSLRTANPQPDSPRSPQSESLAAKGSGLPAFQAGLPL